jgi:CheY-like chemotaxis protein
VNESEAPRAALEFDRALRILVIDDQEIICELVAEYLRADGHEAAIATSGNDALRLFAADTFDLVISDQSMPEMNGGQVASSVKSISPETPVILLTGFGEEMQASGARPASVDLVLGKPVSAADLRHAVYSVMLQGSGEQAKAETKSHATISC